MERLTIPDEPIEGGMRRAVVDARAVREEAMNMYWRLKKYEDICPDPGRLREIDALYLDKCREVAALKEQHRWIPVAERLPETEGTVLVQIRHNYCADGWWAIRESAYVIDHWYGIGNLCEVIAWRLRPEPFVPEI